MFGYVENVTGGQTTLTFSASFESQSTCTLTDDGAPYLWFDANESATQVTFACVVPWTGQPCPDGQWVEYHCFALGSPQNAVGAATAQRGAGLRAF